MKKIFFISVLIIFLFSIKSFSQVTIQLTNGRTYEGKVIKINDSTLVYEYMKKRIFRKNEVDIDRVFSIKFADGNELIVYKQDSALGNDYSVQEMRYFILGEQDAYKNYNATMTAIVGVPIGIAGGYFAPFVSFATPFVYAGVNLIPKIKIKKKTVPNEDYLKHETYIVGYERVARFKKIKNSIWSSITGVALGLTGYLLIK